MSLKPWISPAILASINRRHALFVIKNQNPTDQNKLAYNTYRNTLNDLLREAKRRYLQNQLELNKTNSKKLWQVLNGVIKGKSTYSQLPDAFVNENGELISEKKEIAEAFNNFFISIGETLQRGVVSSDLDPLHYIEFQPHQMFDSLSSINSAELLVIIKKMKNVGAGIDGINANIFKHTAPFIINELAHFFNLCLNNGTFPNALKLAVVKPIFKSGDKRHFNNYRPISILPYI